MRGTEERFLLFSVFGFWVLKVGNMNNADYKKKEGAEILMVVAEAEFLCASCHSSYLPSTTLPFFPFNNIHLLGNVTMWLLTPIIYLLSHPHEKEKKNHCSGIEPPNSKDESMSIKIALAMNLQL